MSGDELEARRVARALDALAAEDADAAEHARGALAWITGEEDLDGLDQQRLQEFLWYVMPRKWLSDVEVHLEAADALGRLLERLGRERYAGICRSETTQRILLTWAEDEGTGFEAFEEAADASGVEPPDTSQLAWGGVMGPHEAAARDAVARALEEAIAEGELAPGSRRWRRSQVEVTRRFLASEHPVEGRPWLQVVLDERRDRWAATARGALGEVRRDVADLLDRPAEVPDDADERLAPLTHLLEQADDGIELTGTHRLRPAFVEHLAERFGWWAPGTRRHEDDVTEVRRLRAYAEGLGVVRRRKRELLVTPRGRELLADPEERWRAAAAGLLSGDDFGAAAGEIALAVLLAAEGPVELDTLTARTREAAADGGWRIGTDREPLDLATTRGAVWRIRPLLELFGLLEVTGQRYDETERWELTAAGRAAAVGALRSRATAPMRTPTW